MCNVAQYAHRWLLNLYSAIQIITQIIHSIILNIKIELNCARTKRRKIDDRHRIHPSTSSSMQWVCDEWWARRKSVNEFTRNVDGSSSSPYHRHVTLTGMSLPTTSNNQKWLMAFCVRIVCLCMCGRSRTTPNERRQINLKWRKKHNVSVFHSNAKSKWKTE